MIYLKETGINIMAIDATFWVAVSFIIFFGGLIYLKVPQKINELLNKLISDIKNEIDESEKLRTEAKTILNQTREKTLKDIGAKKEVLDQQIDDEINKAEKEIEVLRVSAPDKINKIAIETSSELLEKLIGSGVNSSSISAIVDDLSRRNGDKYYGN
jgi:F0F1-type ATP synthase membrane subunit b/b'